jgi:hypothetical protein
MLSPAATVVELAFILLKTTFCSEPGEEVALSVLFGSIYSLQQPAMIIESALNAIMSFVFIDQFFNKVNPNST